MENEFELRKNKTKQNKNLQRHINYKVVRYENMNISMLSILKILPCILHRIVCTWMTDSRAIKWVAYLWKPMTEKHCQLL